jgi:hypothetical protein
LIASPPNNSPATCCRARRSSRKSRPASTATRRSIPRAASIRSKFRIESIIDRVGTTGTVFLGLTIACAQCHDHKFDPISQKEFYQLFAFFNNADEPTLKVTGVTDSKELEELKDRVAQLDAAVKQKVAAWEASLTDQQKKTLKPEAIAALAVAADKRDAKQQAAVAAALRSADNDFGAMADDLAAVRKQMNEGVTTLVMAERAKDPRTTNLFIKGDFTRHGVEVLSGRPRDPPSAKGIQANHKPTRLDLARWITDPENPLTARVVVNRIWQQYFGRGIVETENDFGSQGIAPSHPSCSTTSRRSWWRTNGASSTSTASSSPRPPTADHPTRGPTWKTSTPTTSCSRGNRACGSTPKSSATSRSQRAAC